MSVLIKGFDIPEDGSYAIHIHVKDGKATMRWIDNTAKEIVYVPTPHGELIDRRCFDVVGYSTIDDSFDRGVEFMLDKIDTAPTVIESEE